MKTSNSFFPAVKVPTVDMSTNSTIVESIYSFFGLKDFSHELEAVWSQLKKCIDESERHEDFGKVVTIQAYDRHSMETFQAQALFLRVSEDTNSIIAICLSDTCYHGYFFGSVVSVDVDQTIVLEKHREQIQLEIDELQAQIDAKKAMLSKLV